MKEKEFLDKLHTNEGEWNYLFTDDKIEIPIYYTTDEKENVKIDFSNMEEEFKNKMKKLNDIIFLNDVLKEKDKSIYTFRSNEEPNVQISFELEKSQSEEIDDSIAVDFLSKLLKISDDEVNNLFYLDDVTEVEK